MSLCIVCGEETGRYRCPGCFRRTCSVPCVRRHKDLYSCSGRRSKTDYIPLSEYTTSTLLSDYHLLEDIGWVVDGASRDVVKKCNYQSPKRMKTMSHLQTVARSKGISLYLAPPGLSLHRSNTSRAVYNKKEKCREILWKVQWLFPDCDVQYTSDNVKDTILLHRLLDHFIHPTDGDPLMKHRLRKYVEQRESIEIFMKVERRLGHRRMYHRLCLTESLADNLHDKVVLEYPSLHVVLTNGPLADRYPSVKIATDQTELVPKVRVETEKEDFDFTAKGSCSGTGLSLICDSYSDDM